MLRDKDLRSMLKNEMQSVSFSSGRKEEMVANLSQALDRPTHQWRVLEAIRAFWDGYTEVPLVPGVAVLVLVVIGVGGEVANLLVVDHASAMLLLQVGSETIRSVQGVSAL